MLGESLCEWADLSCRPGAKENEGSSIRLIDTFYCLFTKVTEKSFTCIFINQRRPGFGIPSAFLSYHFLPSRCLCELFRWHARERKSSMTNWSVLHHETDIPLCAFNGGGIAVWEGCKPPRKAPLAFVK